VANEVSARRGYQRRKPAEKLARLQGRMPMLRERRPGSMAPQTQKDLRIIGVQVHAGVQRETSRYVDCLIPPNIS
jgi:hypothetical protein